MTLMKAPILKFFGDGARRSRRFTTPCAKSLRFSNSFYMATLKRRERRAPNIANNIGMHRP